MLMNCEELKDETRIAALNVYFGVSDCVSNVSYCDLHMV